MAEARHLHSPCQIWYGFTWPWQRCCLDVLCFIHNGLMLICGNSLCADRFPCMERFPHKARHSQVTAMLASIRLTHPGWVLLTNGLKRCCQGQNSMALNRCWTWPG